VPSVIDLALSRGTVQYWITSWAIDEASFSDHRTIALYLSVRDLPAAEPTRYRNWRKADWHLFDDHVRRLDLAFDNLEPSSAITTISQAISEAVEAAVPLQTRRAKPRVPWWYPELDRMRERVKRAERRIRSTPNPSADARARFWSLDMQWRVMLAQAEDDHYARRLADTNHRNVWRTLKRHHVHCRLIPPIDGAEDFQEKCNAFRDALFPPADTPP
jgi:hypothetical protein